MKFGSLRNTASSTVPHITLKFPASTNCLVFYQVIDSFCSSLHECFVLIGDQKIPGVFQELFRVVRSFFWTSPYIPVFFHPRRHKNHKVSQHFHEKQDKYLAKFLRKTSCNNVYIQTIANQKLRETVGFFFL